MAPLFVGVPASGAAAGPGDARTPILQVPFVYGPALVAPRSSVIARTATRPAVPALDGSASDDAQRRGRPYRSACNFTTGCP